MATTVLKKEQNYNEETAFDNWGRIVIVNIYDTNGDVTLGTKDWGEPVHTFDGKELEISFSADEHMGDSDGSASVTLRNLNEKTQWSIKINMGIEIIAGYEGKNNAGVVVCGIISNIMDTYDNDGSVTLDITITQNYNYKGKILQTPLYAKGTPYKTIIEEACANAGFPLESCAIGEEYVTDADTSYTNTVCEIVDDLVKKANAKRVQVGEITMADRNAKRCFSYTIDAYYLSITDYGKENSVVAFRYSAKNGLLSVQRGDIFSESSMSGQDNVVTVEAEIMFNWRVRLRQAIYIESARQPHLNGMYIVESYSMTGNSMSGQHAIRLSLYPAQEHTTNTVTIADLSEMYRMDYTKGPNKN